MPQHPELRGQRGSVLAGVLVLSVVLTMAAGGYVLTSGFIQSDQQETYDHRRLQWAGEAAIQLAVRYMRDIPYADITTVPNGAVIGINPAYPGYDVLQNASVRTAMGNPRIRAAYGRTAGGTLYATAWATDQADTVRITWNISNVATGGPWGMTVFTLTDWKDTLLAYRP